MSIDLTATIRKPVPLLEVFAYAETLLAKLTALGLEGPLQAEEVVLGPYEILPSDDGIRRPDSMWEPGYLMVSAGRIAKVGLAHRVSGEEMGYRFLAQETEAKRLRRVEREGYQVMLDAGLYRTRASFCVAATLACSIATLSGTRIFDDQGEFKLGEWIEPEIIAAMLAKHGSATCFEELADRFCAEFDFAPNWPDWRAELAAAELKPRLS